MCGSIISLSKIAYQMWHDHPLGQRGWGLVATGEGGWTKFEKGGIGNAGGSP